MRLASLLLGMGLVAACGPGPEPEPEPWTPNYPLDGVLRANHFQAVGTHNSYHVQPESDLVEDWNYTHTPLDVQLGEEGVRQFELDVWWDSEVEAFSVQHVPLLDAGTTCAWLVECLDVMKAWSDANPGHHPLLLLIEPKDEVADSQLQEYGDNIEAELLDVWPTERLIVPDDVQGAHATVREGVTTDGWPTLGEARQKMIVQLHTGGDVAATYTSDWTSSAGRAMFVGVGPEHDFAGFVAMNDPVGSFEAIRDAVQDGLIVRTRGDASRADFEDGDLTRLQAALDSGAQALSTDHPRPDEETGYVLQIEGGTPSGCNPLAAPAECTSTAIEDPDQLGP